MIEELKSKIKSDIDKRLLKIDIAFLTLVITIVTLPIGVSINSSILVIIGCCNAVGSFVSFMQVFK